MAGVLRRVPPASLLYALLAAILSVALLYHVRLTQVKFIELAECEDLARLPFDPDLPGMTLSGVEDEARAAGVRERDRVNAVQGRTVRGTDDLYPPFNRARAGDLITVRMTPPPGVTGEPYESTIRLRPLRDRPAAPGDWIAFAVVDLALPYLCLALGFWVVAVRIHDRLAWLLLLLLLSLAEFGGASERALYGRIDWFHPVEATYQPVLANLWPMSMMLFGLYFPHRLSLDRRYPWAKWLVIGPILFRVLGTNVATDLLTLRHAAQAVRVEQAFAWMQPIVSVLHFVSISVFFAALGYNMAVEIQADARRRLRLLYVGAAIAVTPLLVALILRATGMLDLSPAFVSFLLAMLFVFPLTMAYVIVVERALDVRLVMRQGVQYLLARGSIRALQIIGSVVIFGAAVSLRSNQLASSRGIAAAALPIAIGVAAIVAVGRFSDRLRRWVDRRFFRDTYNAEQILADLATQVRTMVETQPLLETVSRQISAALHVPRLAMFVNEGGMLQPAYAMGHAELGAVPAPADPGAVGRDDALRQALGAELVLPLSANTRLVGVMALGPKQSEEPFTSGDVRLLDAVATQTGFALENSRLTAQVAAEIAEREKRRREMEIAREVQQRFFPQAQPVVSGLEVAGFCRPALEVGGDYYDFVPRAGGRLGIAIGDISGKGIPASLLMATLRAYLRSQTIQAGHDIAAMVSNLNELVYESSAANRYATFFYAQYDPSTRTLAYVNAGHNPPMVFRRNGSGIEVIRLDVGGPVIGLIRGCSYQQGCMALQAGDLFVSFTDGISEAMNGEMEEWGEERLIATVTPARSEPLNEVLSSIMAGADAHTGAASQHDDMTVVLARCV